MKKVVKMLCIAIVICIFLVLVKGQYEKELLVNANYGMPALIERGRVDNLFIGSSMFRQGIDIEVLEQNEESNYILAYNGNQPVIEAWMLDYLVNSGLEIENLYVDMYVYAASAEPSISDEKLFMEVDLKNKWRLWECISDSEDVGPGQLWRMFVSSNNEMLLTWPIHYALVNDRSILGGKIAYAAGISPEEMSRLEIPKVANTFHEEQRQAIEDMILTAQENQIRIVFVETPKYVSVMEDETYVHAMEEYRQLLDQHEVEYVLAKDICEDMVRDSLNFTDLIHMSSAGKALFTESLMQMQ